MQHITSNDKEYNLDTTGLSLESEPEDKHTLDFARPKAKPRGLINDNRTVDRRRFIRRVGADRREEIRFDSDDRRLAMQDRRACERNWQETDRF